jgi:hypothetical protein
MTSEYESQFQKTNIEKLEIDEKTDSISPMWIKISEMINIFPYNDSFKKNILSLPKDHKIQAWKRSKGDGNCYFRAVISSYFLAISKPYINLTHLTNFLSLLQAINFDSIELPDYSHQDSTERVIKHLNSITSLKSKGDLIKAFISALDLTQNEEFDRDLITVARLLTYIQLLKCKDEEEYSMFFVDGIEFISYDMLEMDREAGDFSLVFLPQSLGIQVIQYMFYETDSPTIQRFPDNSPEDSLKIHIMRRNNHYDILGTMQEIELDQCAIEKRAYYLSIYPEYYDRMQHSIKSNQVILF